jgi:hypothetical protein
MFATIVGVKMSLITQIYFLLKNLDSLEIKISEYQIAQRLEDDAYGRLWYEEKIDEAQKKLNKIKELLTELVKQL